MNYIYIVENERHINEGKSFETVKMGQSIYTDFAEAKRHAEVLHRENMRMDRETSGEPTKISGTVWVTRYQLVGAEFMYDNLCGSYNSGDWVGLVLSHCENNI